MARATMRGICTHRGRIACVAGLTAALALGAGIPALTGTPEPALAATAATRGELASLQKEVSRAAGTYADATSRAAELNEQVRTAADDILRIEQELMPQVQNRAALAARELYKRHASNGGALSMLLNAGSFADFLSMTKYLGTVQSANIAALDELHALEERHASNGGALSMLLNAGSFADFLSMTKYLGTVQSANIAALDELHALEDELNGKLAELSSAKDEADLQLSRAQDALDTAQSAAAKIQAKANAEDAEEAEIARQLDTAQSAAAKIQAKANAEDAEEAEIARQAAEQAAQLQAQQNASQNRPSAPAPDTGPNNAGTTTPQAPDTPAAPKPEDTTTPPAPPVPPTPPAPPAITWKTGVASYYGIGDGFMGGTTANGETVTETSMGSAMLNVPFGTRVEIRYGGRSVIAYVNDRGPYVHGRVIDMQPAVARAGTRVEIRYGGRSVIAYVNDRGPYVHGRVIDMQPAVARALNFLSVGVATVQYRFL